MPSEGHQSAKSNHYERLFMKRTVFLQRLHKFSTPMAKKIGPVDIFLKFLKTVGFLNPKKLVKKFCFSAFHW